LITDDNHLGKALEQAIPQLHDLSFQHCLMDEGVLNALSHGIWWQQQEEERNQADGVTPLLHALSFYSCNLDYNDLSTIVQTAPTNPNASEAIINQPRTVVRSLKHLDLSFNPLTIKSLPILTNLLESNATLESLKLGWTGNLLHQQDEETRKEDRAAIMKLFAAIRSHTCIGLLCVADSGLDRSFDEQELMPTFLKSIQQSRSLQTLDFCDHIDMDQRYWIEALPNLPLRRLNLSRHVWHEWLQGEGWLEWFQGEGFSNAIWQNLHLEHVGDEACLEIENIWIQSILKRNRLMHKTLELFSDEHKLLSVSLWSTVLHKVGAIEQQPDCLFFFVKATLGTGQHKVLHYEK